MLSEDDVAPDFELPGTDGDEIRTYALREFLEDGPALLAFYTFDFAPACAGLVRGLRDTDWGSAAEGLDVLAVSSDGPFAHSRFVRELDLEFPLLCDATGWVAETYGPIHERWQGFGWVVGQAAVLVGGDWSIRHVSAVDPLAELPLEPVRDAVRAL